jgi:hypothetical protein
MATISMIVRVAANMAELKRNVAEGVDVINTTTASMQKMVSAFQGEKLIQHAHNYAAAIHQVGGVERLSAQEKERVNAVMTRALEKYQLLGKQAPSAMVAIANATRQTEPPTNALTARLVALGSAAGTFLGNVAFQAVSSLARATGSLVVEGLRMPIITESFTRLATSIGQSGDAMLRTTRTATKGLISDLDLMQASNKAMLLGLPVTAAEMGTLGEAAMKLGRAMGLDAKQSLDDLITALGRSSPMILDNLGLTVRVGEANERYAEKLGKAAAQLTDAERKTAFYEAAMAAARAKADALGDSHVTLMDSIGQAWVSVQNSFRNAGQNIEAMYQGIGRALSANGMAMAGYSEALIQHNLSLEENAKKSREQFAASRAKFLQLQQETQATATYTEQLAAVRAEVDKLAPETVKQILAAKTLGVETADLVKQFKVSEAALKLVSENTKVTTVATAALDKQAAQLRQTMNWLGEEYMKLDAEAHALNEHVRALADGHEAAAAAAGMSAEQHARLRQEMVQLLVPTNELVRGEGGLWSLSRVIEAGSTSIDHFTAESHRASEQLIEAADATQTWRGQLDDWAKSLTQLAQVSGDSFGGMLQDIAQIVVSYNMASKAADDFAAATTKSGKALALVQGATAVWGATEGGGGKGILGGAASGAAMGAAFGPWGMAIGAAGGALTGVFRNIFGKSEGRQQLEDANAEIKKLQDELLKTHGSIENIITVGGSAGDALAAAWGSQNRAGLEHFKQLLDEFNSTIEDSKAFVSELPGLLNDVTKSGQLASAELLNMVHRLDDMGQMTDEINGFIRASVEQGVTGIAGFLRAGAQAYNDLGVKRVKLADLEAELAKAEGDRKKQLKLQIADLNIEIQRQNELIRVTAITSQASADAFSGALLASFNELQQRGMTVTDALKVIAPAVDDLGMHLTQAGLTGGAAFDQLRYFVHLAQDEITGPALNAVGSLNQAFVGLHNAGLLTQDMFGGLAAQVAQTHARIVAQGHDGEAALRLMQPTLQTIWQLQQDFGYQVDDSTQRLLNQAVQAGIVGDKHRSVQDKMAKGIERLVQLMEAFLKQLGIDVPAAAATAGKSMDAAGQMAEDAFLAAKLAVERANLEMAKPIIKTITIQESRMSPSWDEDSGSVSRGMGATFEEFLPDFVRRNPGDEGRAREAYESHAGRFIPWHTWRTAHSGLFLASDEVPILAQMGEGILSRRGMDALGGPGVLESLNSGRGRGDTPIVIHVHAALDVDGERMARKVVKSMPIVLSRAGVVR